MSCCANPSITNFDHRVFDLENETTVPVTNRLCLRCFHHWYGRNGEVKEYTRAEWNAWIATA